MVYKIFNLSAYKYQIFNIVLFIFCFIPILSYSQSSEYTPKIRFAIETYAYLKGQSTALEMISLQFPALKADVEAAKRKTQGLFGRAKQNIECFLENELGNSDYNTLQLQIDSLLNKQFINPIEKEKYARDFLAKVRERSHLINDTILSKGIISFAYHDAPHQEITDGHIDIFTTKGHPKADHAALKIPIPKSWLAQEAQMPGTIQQFTSYNGKGNEKILIVIYDLPADQRDTLLNEDSILGMIPPNANLIRYESVTIDSRKGMMVEVEETFNYDDEKMKVRMLQFMFVQNQKLYCLQGSIGPVQVTENLEFQIKKHEPLFRLVAARTQIGD